MYCPRDDAVSLCVESIAIARRSKFLTPTNSPYIFILRRIARVVPVCFPHPFTTVKVQRDNVSAEKIVRIRRWCPSSGAFNGRGSLFKTRRKYGLGTF